ncbi:20S proteasome subunit alpha [Pedosphaera parvula]|uniref:20S proteasome A and B subunits n=1 Tax=Pedosphaera parvula (strain Ellin514) TaxID=320771 RepID=B9XEI8_PEDPL|nr:20S proteasome subunit alpha [Pedosphaera parvula]EEF61702.1 20S proteasome A and B subunits [Pedosphaera parvula Ellin514]
MNSQTPIAGDFLSLLDIHKLVPMRTATSPAAPTQTQATTVFAFHFAEGVMMAGDRRATAGNVIVTDKVDKVIEIDAASLLAIAGVPATAFEMARVLQISFEYYRRSQLQPLSLQAKVRALARLLRENLPMTMQGVGVVVPLFATLDQSATPAKPQIYFYDPLGAQFQATDHVASGSGSGTIRSIMSFQEQYGNPKPSQMNLKEAVRFALRLLMVASEFDSATGGVNPVTDTYATIKLLRSTGVETITDKQQADLLK